MNLEITRENYENNDNKEVNRYIAGPATLH